MEFTQAGKDLIKRFEGLRLQAYLCPANKWTIGYGHTGSDVKEGLIISEAEAERILDRDLVRFEQGVGNLLTADISDNQYSALICFAFNLGLGALSGSTLLKKVNAGDFDSCPAEFLKWNHAAGQVLPGLTRRRQAEADLFSNASSS